VREETNPNTRKASSPKVETKLFRIIPVPDRAKNSAVTK